MMVVMILAIVLSYSPTKELTTYCAVNHLALFSNAPDCMEGMDVDESIPDDRREIGEGNVVVQCFHLTLAVAETTVAFDLIHLPHLVKYRWEVSSMAVSLQKLNKINIKMWKNLICNVFGYWHIKVKMF